MKVFVFGAGASRDSQHNTNLSVNLRAPLMRDLFSDRYTMYANEVGLPLSQFTKLRHSAGNNVESYLTKRWEEIQKHVSIRYQEAEKSFFGKLVYYIWRVLLAVSITYNDDERNTYNLLLQSLVSPHEDFGFINF